MCRTGTDHVARLGRADFGNREIQVSEDGGIRAATSPEALARLPTSFATDEAATLTAGNSSFLTDGASAVCLMAEEEAGQQGRKVLARLKGVEFAAVDPNEGLLMAPALAVPRLLKRHGLTAADPADGPLIDGLNF